MRKIIEGYSDIQIQPIEELGNDQFYYNREIDRQTLQDERGDVSLYSCKRYLCDGVPSYESIVNQIVSYHYPNGEENALLRKGVMNPQNNEFINYNTFVEDVKQEVATVLGVRDYR
ncbi:MAG: hypothetical protein ACRDDZ_11085 [Marinifilaceae bacterium]